mmetsp:Transcript_24444/g.62131  ORF Transcript_24444/g.62131 Transcript_24444/m.62131 type:complete len:473 (+) Transcript_24444:1045-2463(+)
MCTAAPTSQALHNMTPSLTSRLTAHEPASLHSGTAVACCTRTRSTTCPCPEGVRPRRKALPAAGLQQLRAPPRTVHLPHSSAQPPRARVRAHRSVEAAAAHDVVDERGEAALLERVVRVTEPLAVHLARVLAYLVRKVGGQPLLHLVPAPPRLLLHPHVRHELAQSLLHARPQPRHAAHAQPRVHQLVRDDAAREQARQAVHDQHARDVARDARAQRDGHGRHAQPRRAAGRQRVAHDGGDGRVHRGQGQAAHVEHGPAVPPVLALAVAVLLQRHAVHQHERRALRQRHALRRVERHDLVVQRLRVARVHHHAAQAREAQRAAVSQPRVLLAARLPLGARAALRRAVAHVLPAVRVAPEGLLLVLDAPVSALRHKRAAHAADGVEAVLEAVHVVRPAVGAYCELDRAVRVDGLRAEAAHEAARVPQPAHSTEVHARHAAAAPRAFFRVRVKRAGRHVGACRRSRGWQLGRRL